MSEKVDTKLTVSRFARPGQEFSGRKEDFNEYKLGLGSIISCNPASSQDGKYIFTIFPDDPMNDGEYLGPQQFRTVEVPLHWRAMDPVPVNA